METSNLVDMLIVVSGSLRMATVLERGVVRLRKPFKFWWAASISLERLIVSGAVNLVGQSVW